MAGETEGGGYEECIRIMRWSQGHKSGSQRFVNSMPCRFLDFPFSGIPTAVIFTAHGGHLIFFSTFISTFIHGILYMSNNDFKLSFKVDYNVALIQITEN